MDIQRFFSKIQDRAAAALDRDRGRFTFKPHRDWLILLVAFLALAVFNAAVGYFLFVKINRGELFIVEGQSTSPSKLINVRKLEDVLAAFGEKESLRRAYLLQRPYVPDPGAAGGGAVDRSE